MTNLFDILGEKLGISEKHTSIEDKVADIGFYYTTDFTSDADEEIVDEMSGYLARGLGDDMMAIKLLVDSDRKLLCAVMVRAGGTSYYFDRDDSNRPVAMASPMFNTDLAMKIIEMQKRYSLLTWGGLTAEFRLMYEAGFAQDEWAAIAAHSVDMLYHLRTYVGNKLNLQMACQNLKISAVERNSISFRIEEAVRLWKEGEAKDRVLVLESMRAYCKLLLAVYGSISNSGKFTYNPSEENGGTTVEIDFSKVWQVYEERWIGASLGSNTENYSTIGVMHNWLVAHADRSKKKLQQLVPPTSTLKDLLSGRL